MSDEAVSPKRQKRDHSIPLESSRQAVVVRYKIPVEKFVTSEFCAWRYTADFHVENQWEFPEIPASDWTVTLSIGELNGEISALVEPNEDTWRDMTSPNIIFVEYAVSAKEHGKNCFKVTPDGMDRCDEEDNPLSELILKSHLEDIKNDIVVKHYRLRSANATVFVKLIFYVTQRADDRNNLNLLESGTLTDCVLVSRDGQRFPAHRAILATQSLVFARMFENDMKEKSTGVCNVDDIDGDLLGIIVRFAYTHETFTVDGKLEKLWDAADKYDMQDLRCVCEEMMIGGIASENAVHYFLFARERGLRKLREKAGKFIGSDPLNV